SPLIPLLRRAQRRICLGRDSHIQPRNLQRRVYVLAEFMECGGRMKWRHRFGSSGEQRNDNSSGCLVSKAVSLLVRLALPPHSIGVGSWKEGFGIRTFLTIRDR